MMSQILVTSRAISILRHLYKCSAAVEQGISSIYQDSKTNSLSTGLKEKVKAYFRYSFLGWATEIRKSPPLILALAVHNSRVVQYLVHFYSRWKDKIIRYAQSSLGVGLVEDVKKRLFFSFVRTISLFIIITILVNAVLSLILQKQINLWTFLMRVLFLFVGTVGLSCEADWPRVKSSSVLIRKIQK